MLGERDEGRPDRSDVRVCHLGFHDGAGVARRPRVVHLLDSGYEREQEGS